MIPRVRLSIALLSFSLVCLACLPEPTPPAERPPELDNIELRVPPKDSDTSPIESSSKGPIGLPAGVLGFGVIARSALQLVEQPLRLNEHHVPDEQEQFPTALTLFVTSNVRGEINVCGCRKNPRGGLARRSAYLKNLRKTSLDNKKRPPIVVDVGDALAKVIAPPPSRDDMPAVERARLVLDVYAELGVEALLVNLRELRIGRERLLELSAEAGIPLISSNLIDRETQELVTQPSIVIEREGYRIGFVGLTGEHRSDLKFLEAQKLALKPGREALNAAGKQLRDAGVDALVLMSGMGIEETTRLLEDWKEESPGKPDFVLVSGTSSLTPQPKWAGGVAMLEPGEGGRQVLVISLIPDEAGKLRLTNHGGARFEAQGKLLATLRTVATKWKRIESEAFRKNRRGWHPKGRIADLKRQADVLARRRAVLKDGLAVDTVPGFSVELVELSKTMEPDPDIQARVDKVETEDDVVPIKELPPKSTLKRRADP